MQKDCLNKISLSTKLQNIKFIELMSVIKKYKELRNSLPEKVKIIAVSKRQEEEKIWEAYKGGNIVFGENQAQAMKQRYEVFPKDIEWHFIGHLQTNKVKYIAPFVKLIHSVDSLSLLEKIDKEAEKNNRIIDCLLQIKIADEDTKFGINCKTANEILTSNEFKTLKNIRITGVMGMASYTPDSEQVSQEFSNLCKCFEHLKSNYFAEADYFKEISAGMSGDYHIAVEQGSTMVRVGSSIFGQRNY